MRLCCVATQYTNTARDIGQHVAFCMREEPMRRLGIGANPTRKSLQSELDAVLQRARAHGVNRRLITGAESRRK